MTNSTPPPLFSTPNPNAPAGPTDKLAEPAVGAQPQPATAPVAQVAAPTAPPAAPPVETVPQDFVYESEHPELPVPFKAVIAGHSLDGVRLSVTAAFVSIVGAFESSWIGRKEIVQLVFQFKGFSVTLYPEMVVAGSRAPGEMTLQFQDPLGDHLPQLRYILNTFIAGDFVTMNGMLGFSGPVKPKNVKTDDAGNPKRRIRSIAVAVISASFILMATNILISRATKSYESRPVFVTRAGDQMTSTAAGQVGYLNPDAKKGEVVYSINTNSGDVLSFTLPCDCEVAVYDGVFEGATVLPIDIILSLFDSSSEPRVETRMSIEGLSKVLDGNKVFLELADGRVIPSKILVTASTNTASLRGDLFVPVIIVPEEGRLNSSDIGKTGRLRISKTLFGFAIPSVLDLL